MLVLVRTSADYGTIQHRKNYPDLHEITRETIQQIVADNTDDPFEAEWDYEEVNQMAWYVDSCDGRVWCILKV